MASVAQIVIELDDQAVVEGMHRVEAGLRKAGSTGNLVMRQLASEQRRAADATALLGSQFESFIDRVFLHARSFRDGLNQIWTQVLSSFVKMVSRMVAEWILGTRQMAGLGGSGFGLGPGRPVGIGGLLGALFGLGSAGVSPARPGGAVPLGGTATPPFNPNAPLSFAGGDGIPTATGGATQGIFGRLAFGGAGGLGAIPPLLTMGLTVGGAGLLGRAFGRGGPITGALGGGLFAAGIGTSLAALGGALASPGLVSLGAAIGGPLGIAIAAAIGALLGISGRGRAKRRAAALEQQFEFAANAVLEQFKRFQIDFESAISQMQALIIEGQRALLSAGLGRSGRRGAENLTRVIEANIQAAREIQRQRDLLAGQIAAMTIPEFQFGGRVPLTPFPSPWGRGGTQRVGEGIFALLHPGEFVMRREAVESLGGDFLAGLNRAPRFQAGGPLAGADLPGLRRAEALRHPVVVNFNFDRLDESWWSQNRGKLVREIRRAVMDGAI